MPKFAQGFFTPKNPHKYVGKRKICFRSSWELVVCNFFDNHPSVLKWASEAIAIPYRCPFRNRVVQYIPDFFVMYVDATGQQHVEVIEVKPQKETGKVKTRSRRDALMAVKNQAKWAAAQAYCAANGMTFRVVTEVDIFRM
jgi:hypothetical protein